MVRFVLTAKKRTTLHRPGSTLVEAAAFAISPLVEALQLPLTAKPTKNQQPQGGWLGPTKSPKTSTLSPGPLLCPNKRKKRQISGRVAEAFQGGAAGHIT